MSTPPSSITPGQPGTSRQPLHARIADALRERIRNRDLLPGDPLPTEEQLQTRYGVSRSVARQAVLTLVAEGLVLRGRGRGSVVAPERQFHRIVNSPAGLYSQIRQQGAQLTTTILQWRVVQAPAGLAQLAGQEVVCLERIRSVDGLPIAFIRTWMPRRFGDTLTADALHNRSLHDTLRQQHGITVSQGHRQVRAVPADAHLAEVLSLHVGAPLLLLEGESRSEAGELVEYFATWHRGDAVAFDVKLGSATDSSTASAGLRQAISEVEAAVRRLTAVVGG